MYTLRFDIKVKKIKKKLHRRDQIRAMKAVKNLTINPFPPGKKAKVMKSRKGMLRLRVGNLRIIYEIIHSQEEVVIRDIGYRGQVY